MNYKQFSNLSCYEEFEIKSSLTGISKIDVLKEIGRQINNYYLFIPNDGIFNWYDLSGNHVENPCMLKELKIEHIPQNITKCIIPDSVTSIGNGVFYNCKLLKEIIIPDSVKCIGNAAFSHCRSLQSITIPDSVEHIGYEAFYGCDSLKEVNFKGKTLEKVKQMNNYSFGIEDESIIKVPEMI